jgi:hypothetical protein
MALTMRGADTGGGALSKMRPPEARNAVRARRTPVLCRDTRYGTRHATNRPMLRARYPTGSKLVSESQCLDKPVIRDECERHEQFYV